MSAGTNSIPATIGHYIRSQGHGTQLMVVSPWNLVFPKYWRIRNATLCSPVGSKIEDASRPHVEPSFIPGAIDETLYIPDAASIAVAL